MDSTRTIALAGGVEMPLVGFGTYQITDPSQCRDCVARALGMGYRLVDTAQAYGNEEAVGAGIKASGIARADVFVTTKLWFRNYEAEQARKAVLGSLARLGTGYVDLMLLHWPFGNAYAAWRVLESFLREGRIRAVGVSNFAPSQLVDFVEFNGTPPAVNQVETHLFSQQKALRGTMQELGVAHQAYAPFGQGMADGMFSLPDVEAAAKAHGRTPRQTALRFLVQQGIAVIPKTVHEDRMQENLDVFSFSLSADEMALLGALDRDRPFIGRPQDPELAKAAMRW